ncbi:MAG: S-layer homology domain-containing protein, partial [Bacillota bacterium]|nr:S-layer homology domain-containing protein [Bacillota bacterium]
GLISQEDADGKNVAFGENQPIDNRIYLGEFAPGTVKTYDLELAVDTAMGDDFQDSYGEIVWVFVAEQVETPDPPPPDLNRKDHFGYLIGRGDNGVQPEAEITRAEVATIFFRMLTDDSRAQYWAQDNPFTDVTKDNWFNNAVSTLCNSGVLQGYPDGTFRPNAFITRAEFATIATRFYRGNPENYEMAGFTDTAKHWAKNFINKAAEIGIINGYPDGSFKPDSNITRAEATQLMNNVLLRAPHKDKLLDGMITWKDNMDTNAWYYAAMQEATNSHECERAEGEEYETWTKLLPVRDWAALEKEWSDAYSKSVD